MRLELLLSFSVYWGTRTEAWPGQFCWRSHLLKWRGGAEPIRQLRIPCLPTCLPQGHTQDWEPACSNQRLHTPPGPLGFMFCPPFPWPEPFSRMQPWEHAMLVRPPGCYVSDWTQLRPLCKLLRCWQMWRSPRRAATYRSFLGKSPCLLNLPPANMEALPSIYGGSISDKTKSSRD